MDCVTTVTKRGVDIMDHGKKIDKIKRILKKHDIRIAVWAMEDLEFTFEYKGELILGDPVIGEEISFDMFHDE